MNKNLLVLCLTWCGCGAVAERPVTSDAPLTACEVELPGMPVNVVSNDDAVLVGLDDGTVLRGAGAGCALRFERSDELGALLDIDARGDAYVLASDAFQAAHFPDSFGDVVLRISKAGEATRVVGAPRGIWGFGVAPSGETMWVSACGPTGVLKTNDLSPVLSAITPWEHGAAALTDDTTYWSTQVDSCTARGSECTVSLLRATPAGTERLVTMSGQLGVTPLVSRCGRGVCVALGDSIQVLNAEGAVEKTLEFSDAERVTSLSMTTRGLYVLVESPGARRLHFMP